MAAESLESKLRRVEFPTLGHFLEEGFLPSPGVRAIAPGMTTVGRARTVQIPDADAAAVNRAILGLNEGDVLVIDMGATDQHACVGAVTIAALRAVGAAGVVVNGLVTDLDDLTAEREAQRRVPVFARGSTSLTTKRHASGHSKYDVPVNIDGVIVTPGDWVLGDRNGVLVASDEALAAVIDAALESDAAEPALLERIAAGEPLAALLFTGE
ncbi:RraA family protein [Leucobacter denitrificans]|uniref:Putative 4-hydroxy-4-methyl-2-oxoglutarate aldolase n=1 Tax=Leucobacter denitrificans TaxID=683042 RepID=A0A7G9S3G7_9MICO|nr:RraA family protein [Leucobacter denitrificans]QNN62392.1 RraA family protein [Leucobacter denitrificans]